MAAIFCAVFGMIQNPAGMGTILSLGLIIVIVGVSYFISAGHGEHRRLQNNGFFGHTEQSPKRGILVTYVAFVAAFVTARSKPRSGALSNN